MQPRWWVGSRTAFTPIPPSIGFETKATSSSASSSYVRGTIAPVMEGGALLVSRETAQDRPRPRSGCKGARQCRAGGRTPIDSVQLRMVACALPASYVLHTKRASHHKDAGSLANCTPRPSLCQPEDRGVYVPCLPKCFPSRWTSTGTREYPTRCTFPVESAPPFR